MSDCEIVGNWVVEVHAVLECHKDAKERGL